MCTCILSNSFSCYIISAPKASWADEYEDEEGTAAFSFVQQ
jgi:hypothetical protein